MIDWFDLPNLTTFNTDNSFYETTSLSLNSMMMYDWLIDSIFLISLHSLQEEDHSMKQEVWVWIVWWYMIDWFDLPNLTTFTTGDGSFYYTTGLNLNSMMIYDWLIWSS